MDIQAIPGVWWRHLHEVLSLLDNKANVMEELAKLTLLTRGLAGYWLGRYGERKASGETDPTRESGLADLNVLRLDFIKK